MNSSEQVLEKLTQIVEENLGDEQFGVTELAEAYAVSRSTLLRLVKKHAGVSVNQFIKDVRLEQANVMLRESGKTVAEISYETGFSSPSYFIKCFREKYGHSPGEARQGSAAAEEPTAPKKIKAQGILAILVVLILLFVAIFYGLRNSQEDSYAGKSIAVLPFKNESVDSSNQYFVNGIMESILNNLQRIEDLRVISRTSVEKYRGLNMTLPDIATDLGVDYVLEGSGQKAGDDILLTVQLIAAREDRHLWSDQYNRKLEDVFQLQAEVSKKIASEIEVVISPQVQKKIEEVPTENLEAYDAFLVGMEFIKNQSEAGLDSAIKYYQIAIELDDQFAYPYAYLAVCYYYKDLYKVEKSYLDQLNDYADRALLLDSNLPEALIARGLYYMQTSRYDQAVEYFEKVLEQNPNSAWTHNFLSEIYHLYLPNTEKYIIHALTAMQLDLSKTDSVDVSISHLILANAFSQSGMMDKASKHVQISLDYDPKNIFSRYLKIYIDMDQGMTIDEAILEMKKVYLMDTTRLDVVKELASLYYLKEDYGKSYQYFNQFLEAKEMFGLNIFPDEDITVAYVLRELGETDRAEKYRKSYETFIAGSNTIYTPFLKALTALYDGNTEVALNELEEFAKQEDYMYWMLLMDDDPIFDKLKNDQRFKVILQGMKRDFERRRKLRVQMLKQRGLWK